MSSVCILTDSSVQFTRPMFPGFNLVTVIPLYIHLYPDLPVENSNIKTSGLPPSARSGINPQVISPSVEDFRLTYLNLARNYNEIIAIFLSSKLNALTNHAQQAARMVQGRISVQVIDSQTTSVGLGYLVQTAAEASLRGESAVEIERVIRGIIPHVYSIFCIPGLTYLYHAGFIDHAQAVSGEILNLLPIFTLEEGHLTPFEKARNLRNLTDYFQEFLEEFNDLYHISFIQSSPPLNHESRVLRDFAQSSFTNAPFSEHAINLPLAALFGPRSTGVIVIEMPDDHD
jgi:DegV family protein with EDD domain